MLIDRSFAELLPDTAPDPTERRSAPRIPVETDVTLGGHGRVLAGVSSDVSLGGLFVSAYAPMPVGTRVAVRLRLPTGQVMGTGIVRWVREARPGRLGGMGLELRDLGELDRSVLAKFCGNRPRFLSYEEIVEATH
ncbi:MAG: PilZ domain-containing protein [Polyangiaceae bacterium]